MCCSRPSGSARTLVAYGLGDFLGTALPRQPWPGRIGAILVVDVSAEPPTRGRVAAYQLVPFIRLRDGARERLPPLDDVAGPIGERARHASLELFPRRKGRADKTATSADFLAGAGVRRAASAFA